MVRERVIAGLNRARAQGRRSAGPRYGQGRERYQGTPDVGDGMLKIAKTLGIGVSTVQRYGVKRRGFKLKG